MQKSRSVLKWRRAKVSLRAELTLSAFLTPTSYQSGRWLSVYDFLEHAQFQPIPSSPRTAYRPRWRVRGNSDIKKKNRVGIVSIPIFFIPNKNFVNRKVLKMHTLKQISLQLKIVHRKLDPSLSKNLRHAYFLFN